MLYSSLIVKHWAQLQELLGENQYDAGGSDKLFSMNLSSLKISRSKDFPQL